MKFYMILAHYPDQFGLDGVYLDYIKFPMEVDDPSEEYDANDGLRTLNSMESVYNWAERRFDGDYEIITLDTALAAPVEGL
jgi:hypothetical protein